MFRITVIIAVLGQIPMPIMARASTSTEMANSTPKTVDIEEKTEENIEDSIKLAFDKGIKAETLTAKKTVKKRASKTAINSPGESVKLTLAEGEKPYKVMTAVITAYNSVPGQTDNSPFIAATGKRVHDSMIAANKLPFGTRIKIPSLFGDKIFVVEDRMNSRYGLGRIDIWMAEVPDARKFGVQRVEVEIYRPEEILKKEVAVNTVRE